MNLSDFMIQSRIILKDVGLKALPDPVLVRFANEGKNDLYRLLRTRFQDFFLTSSNITVTCAAPPNANIAALPSDFSQLKDILCTQLIAVNGTVTQTISHPTEFTFMAWDRHDVVFKHAMVNTFSGTDGAGQIFFYDLHGVSSMQIVPPIGTVSATFVLNLTYVSVPPDMALPTDSPSAIPSEYHDYIVTWMVVEAMRVMGDQRLSGYETKLGTQAGKITTALQESSLNEPQERGGGRNEA